VKTAVDTNAFLALLYDDDYATESEQALRSAYRDGRLVTMPMVYAELAAANQFSSIAALDTFLEDFSVSVIEPSRDALFRAGEAFNIYTDWRSNGLQCPSCGATQEIHCEKCNDNLSPRQHIAADFLIGGHAAMDADSLVTFDSSFYESYFPEVDVRPKRS